MPHYHFHVRNDFDSDDEEGVELSDDAAAREFAVENARVLVCESIREYGNVNLDHYIEVTDGQRLALFAVTFREAFTIVD